MVKNQLLNVKRLPFVGVRVLKMEIEPQLPGHIASLTVLMMKLTKCPKNKPIPCAVRPDRLWFRFGGLAPGSGLDPRKISSNNAYFNSLSIPNCSPTTKIKLRKERKRTQTISPCHLCFVDVRQLNTDRVLYFTQSFPMPYIYLYIHLFCKINLCFAMRFNGLGTWS